MKAKVSGLINDEDIRSFSWFGIIQSPTPEFLLLKIYMLINIKIHSKGFINLTVLQKREINKFKID